MIDNPFSCPFCGAAVPDGDGDFCEEWYRGQDDAARGKAPNNENRTECYADGWHDGGGAEEVDP